MRTYAEHVQTLLERGALLEEMPRSTVSDPTVNSGLHQAVDGPTPNHYDRGRPP